MHRLPIRHVALIVATLLLTYFAARIVLDVRIADLRVEAQQAATTVLLTDGSAFRALALAAQASTLARVAVMNPDDELDGEYQRIVALRAHLLGLEDAELIAVWLDAFSDMPVPMAPTGTSLGAVPGAQAHFDALRDATATLHRIEAQAMALRASDSMTAHSLLDGAEYFNAMAGFHAAISQYREVVSGAAQARVHDTQGRLSRMLSLARGLSLAWIAFGLWLLWLVWWRMLRPLASLSHQADRIAAGNYTQRNTLRVDRTEFGQLARVMNDMSAAVAATVDTLERQARTDALTGLDNRRELHTRLAAEIERARRSGSKLGVAMLDLDHFKRINDGFGHAAGDAVLKTFAETVRATIRQADLFMRYGGEEFVLVAVETIPDELPALLDRVRGAVSEMKVIYAGETLPRITVSIGYVEIPTQAESADDALQAADAAMYAAKREGRNRVVRYRPV